MIIVPIASLPTNLFIIAKRIRIKINLSLKEFIKKYIKECLSSLTTTFSPSFSKRKLASFVVKPFSIFVLNSCNISSFDFLAIFMYFSNILSSLLFIKFLLFNLLLMKNNLIMPYLPHFLYSNSIFILH